MNKNNTKNPYTAALTKTAFGKTTTFDRSERGAVQAEITRLNQERNPFQFSMSVPSRGPVQVTRVIPKNLFDRRLYIDGITKGQLIDSIRVNNGSKEGAARDFGISARSIGRMMSKLGVKASAPATPSKSVKAKVATKASNTTTRTPSKVKAAAIKPAKSKR